MAVCKCVMAMPWGKMSHHPPTWNEIDNAENFCYIGKIKTSKKEGIGHVKT